MKNILSILLLAMMACCWSCSGGGEDVPTPTPTPKPEEKPKIELTTAAPVAPQEGGSATVTFTSTEAWTIDVTEGRAVSWCSVTPTSGSKGTNTLTITTTGNDTYDERNAKITIKAGATNQTFTITQKQKDGLTVTSNKVEVKAEGGDIAIEVKANVSVTYEIEESAKDWISANESRGLTTKTLNFTAKANEKEERRQGNIVLKGGDGLTETVTVYQEGEKPTLVITSDDIIVGSDGETIKIELKSNVDYTMILPEVAWISQDDSRAISAYTHYLTVSPNESYDQRSAKVFFQNEAEGLKDSINITQLQKDAIIVAKNEYEVATEGGQLEFKVSSNVDFEVSTSVDWIKQNTESRGLVEKVLNFTIEENNDKDSREGEIRITLGNLKQTIKVVQIGYEAVERAALIEFFKAAGGDDWLDKTNWCSDKPLGEWYGIDLASNGMVAVIDLGWNSVSGDLALMLEPLYQLSSLQKLSLSDNPMITGIIPSEISELNNLTELLICTSGIGGEIPTSIGDMIKLRSLYLRSDTNTKTKGLTGTLPKSMANLINLERLYLECNNLTGDALVVENYANLERLSLYCNQFSGRLPKMTNVCKAYDVSSNKFSGTIPESHINLFNLIEELDLHKQEISYQIFSNNLTGEIPVWLADHQTFSYLWPQILVQNKGYGFNQVNIPANDNKVLCYDGTFLNLEDVYRNNEYTLLYRWTPDCPYGRSFPYHMATLLKRYKEKGLEVVCMTDIKYSMEEIKPLMDYLGDCKVFWEISDNDTYSNNPFGSRNLLFGLGGIPLFIGVNSNGMIDYVSEGGELCPEAEYPANKEDVLNYVCNIFGDNEFIGDDPDYYTSTDYSQDGDVITLQTATVGKGINLTFMGEAFVDKDMEPNGLYEQKMQEAMEKLFSIEPYKSMRNRFNVYAVKVISPNAEFSEYAEHRINESDSICFEYAQKIPNADKNPPMVSVVYNTTYWTDRSYTTMYTDGAFVGYMMDGISDVLIHEIGGHGFANLLDEYVESGLENSTLSQDEATLLDNLWKNYSWGANVDWRNDASTVKWTHFLNDSRYAGEGLGLYEGAYLYGYGAYRPTENSMMRYNDSPFNAPSREQIYKRIMQRSEGEDWKYNYEEFVKYDAINRNAESRSAVKSLTDTERREYTKNHRPPTIIKGTWRDAMKVKSQIVFPLR